MGTGEPGRFRGSRPGAPSVPVIGEEFCGLFGLPLCRQRRARSWLSAYFPMAHPACMRLTCQQCGPLLESRYCPLSHPTNRRPCTRASSRRGSAARHATGNRSHASIEDSRKQHAHTGIPKQHLQSRPASAVTSFCYLWLNKVPSGCTNLKEGIALLFPCFAQ